MLVSRGQRGAQGSNNSDGQGYNSTNSYAFTNQQAGAGGGQGGTKRKDPIHDRLEGMQTQINDIQQANASTAAGVQQGFARLTEMLSYRTPAPAFRSLTYGGEMPQQQLPMQMQQVPSIGYGQGPNFGYDGGMQGMPMGFNSQPRTPQQYNLQSNFLSQVSAALKCIGDCNLNTFGQSHKPSIELVGQSVPPPKFRHTGPYIWFDKKNCTSLNSQAVLEATLIKIPAGELLTKVNRCIFWSQLFEDVPNVSNGYMHASLAKSLRMQLVKAEEKPVGQTFQFFIYQAPASSGRGEEW